jgi:protein-S-isoprenylcysteine O-methyltransferase Ste14
MTTVARRTSRRRSLRVLCWVSAAVAAGVVLVLIAVVFMLPGAAGGTGRSVRSGGAPLADTGLAMTLLAGVGVLLIVVGLLVLATTWRRARRRSASSDERKHRSATSDEGRHRAQ